MISFISRPFTQEDAHCVSGWQYAAPYDVYGGTIAAPHSAYRALCDAQNGLCGFFCWGEEAKVSAAKSFYTACPDALDIGIGLRPDLTGKGLGLSALSCALQWLREAFAPPFFRLAVYAWNVRALRVYKRSGFEMVAMCGGFYITQLDDRPFREASVPLQNGMRLYPSDPPFDRHLSYHQEDCGWNVSILSMSAHAGTHIDAPAHVGLLCGVEQTDLSLLHGTVQLLDFTDPDFDSIRHNRILLANMARGLTLAEAWMLIDARIRFVGVDRLSVGTHEEEWLVHKNLLENGVVILENANLQGFTPGFYQMRCLPLLIPGSDGAPVRLLLREEYV